MAKSKINKTTTKKAQPTVIVHQTTVKQLQREKGADANKWHNAINSFNMGRRSPFYNLLDQVLEDPLLSSVVEKRLMGVTNCTWIFNNPDGSENEEIQNLIIDTPAFENILEEIQNSILLAHSLLECGVDNDGNFVSQLINRKHVNPINGTVVKEEGDEKPIAHYREAPDSYYCLEVGKPGDKGILFKVALYVLFKRGNLGDYAQLCELFGIPQRVGKYDLENINQKLALNQNLENAGSATWISIPKGTDIEYVENKTNTDGSLFVNFQKQCNEEITIGILGQTMTTQDGSSHSQSEVHLKVEKNINKKDIRRCRRVLNKSLIPILENLGYKCNGGSFNIKEETTLSVKERLEILNLVDAKTPVSDDEYYTVSGVPKPDNYDELKKKKEIEPTPPAPDPKQKEKGPAPKDKKEKKLSWKNLFNFFAKGE